MCINGTKCIKKMWQRWKSINESVCTQRKGVDEERNKPKKRVSWGPVREDLEWQAQAFGLPEARRANGRCLSKGSNFIDYFGSICQERK